MSATLFGIFGLGIGGALLGLGGMLRPTLRRLPAYQFAPWALFALAGGIALASDVPHTVWLPVALAGLWLLMSHPVRTMHRLLGSRPGIAWGLLVGAGPAI